MDEGDDRMSRNAMTRMLFAYPLRFNLQDGFPAVTTKKLAFKAMKAELLWFIEGSGDDNRLKELTGTDKTIWTDNAEAPYWKPKAKFPGDLGRIYGVQWRNWRTADGREVDQLTDVIERLKKNPYDRRLIVTAWNPGELDDMALPPCHVFFHLAVFKGKVSLHMYQRSCDMFLGVPFNIASYALLLSMIAHAANMEPYELVITFGDAHIYHDHFDAVKQQLTREPLPLPKLWLNPEVRDIDKFTMDDIRIDNYTSHPAIKAQMIV
ncbi:MAG: thyA [Candidatus Paceibacter sp.]|nr:thyA [Candidatus Paceibacter sp.]